MPINPMTLQTAAMQAVVRSVPLLRRVARSAGKAVRRKTKKAKSARRKVKKAAKGLKRMVKGSAAARAHMAKLRRMRK